jgi:hypothetical protein
MPAVSNYQMRVLNAEGPWAIGVLAAVAAAEAATAAAFRLQLLVMAAAAAQGLVVLQCVGLITVQAS